MTKSLRTCSAILALTALANCTPQNNEVVLQNTALNGEQKASPSVAYKGWSLGDIYRNQENLPLYLSVLDSGAINGINYDTKRYWGGWIHQVADLDFDGDGIRDKIVTGVNFPLNAFQFDGTDAERTQNGDCPLRDCQENFVLPVFFKGLGNGHFKRDASAFVDRETGGVSYGHQITPGDFNGDGILDVIITDHGWNNGLRNYQGSAARYYLSQPDGTWLESSDTHMNGGRRWTNFNHGITTGDIDNDGDLDIVETTIHRQTTSPLWCRLNDGYGHMSIKACGGGHGWGVSLADFDSDGCLDAITTGTENGGSAQFHFTGISWGNCRGNFSRGTRLKAYGDSPNSPNNWGDNPLEAFLYDLDNDGDEDILINRTGTMYVGSALQVIENLGNRNFEDHGLIVYNAPPSTPSAIAQAHDGQEGNNWNSYAEFIYFKDINADGLADFIVESSNQKTNLMQFVNNGNFMFHYIGKSPKIATHKW